MSLHYWEASAAKNWRIAKVYTDGGVIWGNPSQYGGTWAFVMCNAMDEPLIEAGGIILPGPGYYGLGTISNNIAELVAVRQALHYVPEGFNGEFFIDSLNAIRWVFSDNGKWTNVPAKEREHIFYLKAKMLGPEAKATLVGGHPTTEELQAGLQWRGEGETLRSYPVSVHNVRCDAICTDMAYKRVRCLRLWGVLPDGPIKDNNLKEEQRRLRLAAKKKD